MFFLGGKSNLNFAKATESIFGDPIKSEWKWIWLTYDFTHSVEMGEVNPLTDLPAKKWFVDQSSLQGRKGEKKKKKKKMPAGSGRKCSPAAK